MSEVLLFGDLLVDFELLPGPWTKKLDSTVGYAC